MNDEELAAVVKESVRGAHMDIPAEQIVRHSRAIRAWRRMPALAGGLTAAAAAGLQQTLQADGINAIVRQVPSRTQTRGKRTLKLPTCHYAATNNAPPAVQAAVVSLTLPRQGGLAYIIHPDAMPPGSALFLAFLAGEPAVVKNDNTGILAITPAVLNNDTVPACVPPTRTMPSSVLNGT
jgi:hypothetical protein